MVEEAIGITEECNIEEEVLGPEQWISLVMFAYVALGHPLCKGQVGLLQHMAFFKLGLAMHPCSPFGIVDSLFAEEGSWMDDGITFEIQLVG